MFSIAICRPIGDKWQSKTHTVSSDFLSTFVDSISVFDCRIPGVMAQDLCNIFDESIHIVAIQLEKCDFFFVKGARKVGIKSI